MKLKIIASKNVREHVKYGQLIEAMEEIDWKPHLTNLKRVLGVPVSTLVDVWRKFERDHGLSLRLVVTHPDDFKGLPEELFARECEHWLLGTEELLERLRK